MGYLGAHEVMSSTHLRMACLPTHTIDLSEFAEPAGTIQCTQHTVHMRVQQQEQR